MTNCPSCQSIDTIKKGKEFASGIIKQRYKCKACSVNFYDIDTQQEPVFEQTKSPVTSNRTWVITAAVSSVPVNKKLFATLLSYCSHRNAELLIVPVKYQQHIEEDYSWDIILHPYLIQENTPLTTGLKLLAGINVSPAIGNPLSGFEPFSKGDSIIIPHPQLMMKSIAVNHTDKSAIIITTGAITESTYTATKQGTKAEFNHSFSALVVEEDSEINGFHIRVLNSDDNGDFYDIDMYYNNNHIEHNTNIPAIVLGDEHIVHIDPIVTEVTFSNADSIVNTLRPTYICRHDVLDFYSANHHHKHNFFTQYAKYISGKNVVENELKLTVDYITDTTPQWATSVIVSSNHNDHLTRWLQESNPKTEPWNAVLYHELMYLMLKNTKMGDSGAEYANPFELWYGNNYTRENIKFISGNESFKIHDIELAYHGHQGTNGSRGSAEQFSKLGDKTITGHSHSPSIFGGCYTVGHSCYSKLEYNNGPSSWAQAHCIVQPNGKRQIIFINGGKWKR